jgi:hypothetical protein
VLADEHRMAASPWSAPLLSIAPHRMPLPSTGQGSWGLFPGARAREP